MKKKKQAKDSSTMTINTPFFYFSTTIFKIAQKTKQDKNKHKNSNIKSIKILQYNSINSNLSF